MSQRDDDDQSAVCYSGQEAQLRTYWVKTHPYFMCKRDRKKHGCIFFEFFGTTGCEMCRKDMRKMVTRLDAQATEIATLKAQNEVANAKNLDMARDFVKIDKAWDLKQQELLHSNYKAKVYLTVAVCLAVSMFVHLVKLV